MLALAMKFGQWVAGSLPASDSEPGHSLTELMAARCQSLDTSLEAMS